MLTRLQLAWDGGGLGCAELSRSAVSDSLRPHGPAGHLCAWGFSRQEYWSALPCLPPGDLPKAGLNPGRPHCRQILYRLSHQTHGWHGEGHRVLESRGSLLLKLGSFSILSMVKEITSPGWMHETNARAWCTGKTQRDLVEREVGGGIGMGNTCISKADSCQCMTKTTTIL